ncbi:MAG: hypothetical protein EOM15_17870 [Spirochaetia bacterium]|nr:hypothetical protein [Spirochaetia bacterium]
MQDVLERDVEGRLVVCTPDFELKIGRDVSALFDGIRADLIDFNLLNGAELSMSVYRSYRSEKKRAGAIGPDPALSKAEANSMDVDSFDATTKVTSASESVNSADKRRK